MVKRSNWTCRAFGTYDRWAIAGRSAECLEKPCTTVWLAISAKTVQIPYLDESIGGSKTRADPVGVGIVTHLVVDSPDCDVSAIYVVAVGAAYRSDLIPVVAARAKCWLLRSLSNRLRAQGRVQNCCRLAMVHDCEGL